MKRIRVLHLSDLHFDTPFSDLNRNFSEKRREELRETFGKVVNIAAQEKVDLMLISGDVFDNLTVMKTTLDYIIKKLKEIPEIKVFISPGNHDPYNEKSFYSMIKWPENVHIFKEEMERVFLPDLNVDVYGRAFSKAYERESLLKDFNSTFKVDKDRINLMVIHGDISNNGKENEYNPITLEEIGESNMDYIALGHRHSFSGIQREKNTYYAYCGNPEGRGFDEIGEKGILLGEIGKSYINLNFLPISKRTYEVIEINVEGSETYEEIKNIIENSIPKEKAENNLYKLILKGELHQDFYINTSVLMDKIKDYFYYVKLVNDTDIAIDYEALSKEMSLKGMFTKRLLMLIEEAENEEERKRLKKALRIGVQSLNNKELIIQ